MTNPCGHEHPCLNTLIICAQFVFYQNVLSTRLIWTFAVIFYNSLPLVFTKDFDERLFQRLVQRIKVFQPRHATIRQPLEGYVSGFVPQSILLYCSYKLWYDPAFWTDSQTPRQRNNKRHAPLVNQMQLGWAVGPVVGRWLTKDPQVLVCCCNAEVLLGTAITVTTPLRILNTYTVLTRPRTTSAAKIIHFQSPTITQRHYRNIQ